MAFAKDSEGKKFKWGTLAVFAALTVTAFGGVVAVLGGNTELHLPSKN